MDSVPLKKDLLSGCYALDARPRTEDTAVMQSRQSSCSRGACSLAPGWL